MLLFHNTQLSIDQQIKILFFAHTVVSVLNKIHQLGCVSCSITVAETLLSSAAATILPLRQRILVSDSNYQEVNRKHSNKIDYLLRYSLEK